jgi:SAM-dependent methyltransferase
MPDKSSYDAVAGFGALYDEVPAYATRRDVEFYVDEAERRAPRNARVLELGCGTGRVLLPLARAGHRVIGVDRSLAMLARCRKKLSLESPAVQSRVALCEGDIRDFELPPDESGQAGAVAFAIAPFRIMQHLVTVADQLRGLAGIRQKLTDGGCVAFDAFNPNFALMATDRSAETEDTPERQLADGRFFRRTARVIRVRWVEQVSEVELIYYLREGRRTTRLVQAFEMRWYTPPELEHLLSRAGFAVEDMYGDFERGRLHDDAPEIVVIARRT